MTPEEKQKREKLYQSMVRLRNYSEWKDLEKEVQEIISAHKNAAFAHLSSNSIIDAQRQSWVIDGVEECITRPKFIIDCHDNTFEAIRERFKQTILDKLSKKSVVTD